MQIGRICRFCSEQTQICTIQFCSDHTQTCRICFCSEHSKSAKFVRFLQNIKISRIGYMFLVHSGHKSVKFDKVFFFWKIQLVLTSNALDIHTIKHRDGGIIYIIKQNSSKRTYRSFIELLKGLIILYFISLRNTHTHILHKWIFIYVLKLSFQYRRRIFLK